MNKHQLRYAAAKAAYDAVLTKIYQQVPEPRNNAEVKPYLDTVHEIKRRLGYDTILAEMHSARKALLDWGKSVTLRIATPSQRAELAEMYDHLDRYPSIRDQVIDATMRLDAAA